MYVFVPCLWLLLTEARRRNQILWNWNQLCCESKLCLLERAASALKYLAISPTPNSCFKWESLHYCRNKTPQAYSKQCLGTAEVFLEVISIHPITKFYNQVPTAGFMHLRNFWDLIPKINVSTILTYGHFHSNHHNQ